MGRFVRSMTTRRAERDRGLRLVIAAQAAIQKPDAQAGSGFPAGLTATGNDIEK